jgi:hypothetical protein
MQKRDFLWFNTVRNGKTVPAILENDPEEGGKKPI